MEDAGVFERLGCHSRGLSDASNNLVWADDLLTFAVACQQLDIARLILLRGADDNRDSGRTFLCGDHHGAPRMTPLKIAALVGGVGLVRTILESATDSVHLEANVRECCGTPLWAAVSQNHVDAVALLLRHGADIESKGYYLGDHKVKVDWDQTASTPLWEAAHRGLVVMVEILVRSGADTRVVDLTWEQMYRRRAWRYRSFHRTANIIDEAGRARMFVRTPVSAIRT